MKISKLVLRLFIGSLLCLFIEQTALSQTEKLGIVSITPPKGWTRTAKENAVAYSEIDRTTGRFCIITLYGATRGTGKAQSDFAREWTNLVVKPLSAERDPKTETESAEGWTATAGGTAVEYQGSKAFAFLTVFTGQGKTVSVLGVFNDPAYLDTLTAFVTGLDIDKAVGENPAATREETKSLAPAVSTQTMNVGSLVTEFEKNEVRAYQVWVGKRVRLNGVVNSIDVKSDGRIAITFKSTASAYGNVRCYFNKSQSPRVAALSAHLEATVEGTVRGWEGGYSGAKVFVLVEDCTVP